MDSRYAQAYRDLYTRHWWWRAREEVVMRAVQRLGLPPNASILDIGCGDALLFPLLEGFGSVQGLEPDRDLVRESTLSRYRVHIAPFDASFRPEQEFDLVLMLDVLEHLDNPIDRLRQVRDLLRPGGKAILTVPALAFLWTGHDVLNHHRKRYDGRTLMRESQSAGLEVEDLRYLFLWPVLGKLLVRLAERLVSRPPQPARVPGRALNRVLLALTRLDLAVGTRARMPVGSSLLARLGRRIEHE